MSQLQLLAQLEEPEPEPLRLRLFEDEELELDEEELEPELDDDFLSSFIAYSIVFVDGEWDLERDLLLAPLTLPVCSARISSRRALILAIMSMPFANIGLLFCMLYSGLLLKPVAGILNEI